MTARGGSIRARGATSRHAWRLVMARGSSTKARGATWAMSSHVVRVKLDIVIPPDGLERARVLTICLSPVHTME